MQNGRLEVCEIAEAIFISNNGCTDMSILHEHLRMKKMATRWMSHLLTIGQKHQWVNLYWSKTIHHFEAIVYTFYYLPILQIMITTPR